MTPLLRFSCLALCLGSACVHAAPETWEGSTPFATGTGNRVIGAFAVSPDGQTLYAGTGSGTVFRYIPVDTVPNAFSFTAQTQVALNAVLSSNTITVSGINASAPISITGGTYSVNAGAYTALPGTVNLGDQVTVRLNASGSYSTSTSATLLIGGVSAVFSATTMAPNVVTYIAPSSTGTGSVAAQFAGGAPGCNFASQNFSVAAPPPGVSLPHGVFSFSTTTCGAGATLSFTITYPQTLPADAKYYKFGPEFGGSAVPHWYVLQDSRVINGNQITFTITDNGLGDNDPTPGVISDPGGVGVPAVLGAGNGAGAVSGVPTLSEWGLLVLSLLVGWLAWPQRRVFGHARGLRGE